MVMINMDSMKIGATFFAVVLLLSLVQRVLEGGGITMQFVWSTLILCGISTAVFVPLMRAIASR